MKAVAIKDRLARSFSPDESRAIGTAAKENGTPFFIYDPAVLSRQVHNLRTVLPDGADLLYSVKANPNPKIISLLSRQCSGVEVATSGELAAALAGGVRPQDIAMIGPGKRPEDHVAAIANRIGIVVVESPAEMTRLQSLAASSEMSVALRINPGRATGGSLRMGGDTQFGMDVQTAVELTRNRASFPNLVLKGVHGYAGTQQTSANAIVAWARAILAAATEIEFHGELPMTWLDLGGGFGYPIREGDAPLHFEGMKERLTECVGDYYRKVGASGRQILFESGRYLVAPSGIIVTQVIDVKVTAGRTYVIVDAGIAQFGFDDRTAGMRPLAMTLLSEHSSPEVEVCVCGPLCTPADRIAAKALLPLPHAGDLICIHNVGAYGLTGNPGLFLGQGFAPELIWAPEGLISIRRRFTAEDYLRATVGHIS